MKLLKLFKKKKKVKQEKNRDYLLKYCSESTINFKKIGTEYGGWYIPENTLSKDSICYCFGAGEDVSFDLGLINIFKCAVVSIDPTPRAIKHWEDIINNTKAGVSTPILSGNISEVYYSVNKDILDLWKFLAYGAWSDNSKQKFYFPANPAWVSHSIVNLQNTDDYFEAECKTVKTIMQGLGHDSADLIKFDIEGAEHNVIRSMIQDNLKPLVLLVEFDQPCDIQKIEDTIVFLIENGYELHRLDYWNATFLRK